ncbi:hypothetical protein MBLNU459_g5668t1 [Dothideomycetes sp. NU459]
MATNPPSATVYASNLEERIKIKDLIDALRELFSEYGNIIDVVAKSSLRRKGQAFIVFDTVESAQNAIDEINGFEIFGKAVKLDFAKTRSDATVQIEGTAEELELHKRHRKAEKERKQALEAAEEAKNNLKRAAPAGVPDQDPNAQRAPKAARGAGLKGAGGAGAGVVPDEYLPPNNILFVRQIPEDYGVEGLTAIFSRFPGFVEIRVPPTRKGIAFVEYEMEEGAITAKEATGGMTLGENTIRVTFQRK